MRYAIILSILLITSSFRGVYKPTFKVTYLSTLPLVEVTVEEVEKKDVLLLARLINSEAKWEPFEGKLAVGQVVVNRINSSQFSYATNLSTTIYEKKQFDGIRTKYFREKPNLESIRAARLVLIGRKVLPDNCFFYANEKASTDKDWINYLSKHYSKKVINNHTFYIKKL